MEKKVADYVTGVMRFMVRMVVLSLGFLVVASLLLVLLAVGLLWGLRALWAKVTGQPMAPWIMQINPGAAWMRASRAASRWQSVAKPPGERMCRDEADVTDVQIK